MLHCTVFCRPEDRIFSLNIPDMVSGEDHCTVLGCIGLFQVGSGLADEDILLAWLTDLHYEEYFNLFISAGYDMPTISR